MEYYINVAIVEAVIATLGKHQYFSTANFRAKILDFRGFDSSIILLLRGGIPRPARICSGYVESTSLSRDNLSRDAGRDRRGGDSGVGPEPVLVTSLEKYNINKYILVNN